MYFPTLSKREIWSEYMKDLKSRQVNDSTMKFFSAVKFFQCQPEVCPDTERLHIQWYAELEKPVVLNEIQDLVEGGLKLKGHVEPCKGTFNLCKPLQMPHSPQSRRYCGTIHFPTDHTQWADAAHCINTDPYTRFFICQPENCPTTEKLHVQF